MAVGDRTRFGALVVMALCGARRSAVCSAVLSPGVSLACLVVGPQSGQKAGQGRKSSPAAAGVAQRILGAVRAAPGRSGLV